MPNKDIQIFHVNRKKHEYMNPLTEVLFIITDFIFVNPQFHFPRMNPRPDLETLRWHVPLDIEKKKKKFDVLTPNF